GGQCRLLLLLLICRRRGGIGHETKIGLRVAKHEAIHKRRLLAAVAKLIADENSIKPVFRSNELVSRVIAGCIELVGVRIATIASVLQIIDLSYLGLLLLCSIIFPGVVFLHAIDGEKGVAWEAELIRYCLDPQRLALFRVEL